VKDLLRGEPARHVDGRAPARGCTSFKNAGIGRLRRHWGGGSRGHGDDQLMRLGWNVSCEVSRPVHVRRRAVLKRNAFSYNLRNPTN
jgi:hypothetical protein